MKDEILPSVPGPMAIDYGLKPSQSTEPDMTLNHTTRSLYLVARRTSWGRVRKPSWTDWVRKLRNETMQDKYDQALIGMNLNARVLRKDPRAILGMAPPPVRSLPEDGATGPKRVCTICFTNYAYNSGQDSPCGHVKKDGTIVP